MRKNLTGKIKRFFYYLSTIFSGASGTVFIVLSIIVILLATLVFLIEKNHPDGQIKNALDAIWWLIVTIATIGYGDFVPKSNFGRILGLFIILFGVSLFSIFTGNIASILIEIRLKERRGLGKVTKKNHIVILGWNSNLEKIIDTMPNYLQTTSFDLVLVFEGSEQEFDEIRSRYQKITIQFIHGDYTKESVLNRANISEAAHIIILADRHGKNTYDDADDRSLSALLTIRSINPDKNITVEVIKNDKSKQMIRAGADTIIESGAFNPVLLTSSLLSTAMNSFLDAVILKPAVPKIRIHPIPRQFVGKTFQELFSYIREKTNAMPIGLLSSEKDITIEDLMSTDNAIDNFIRKKLKENDWSDESQKEQKVRMNPVDTYIIDEDDDFIFLLD